MENIGVIRKGTINNRTLDFNGKPICRATANTNELGTYIVGNKLYDNGRLVAVSSQENPQLMVTDIVKFGEVRLDTDGMCINITLENYNKLYNRKEVPGYKYFDPFDVYNIVNDVSTAEIITYTRGENLLIFTDPNNIGNEIVYPYDSYVLYNNVIGETTYNTEDFNKILTEYNSPQLYVRYFNPRISQGDTIEIPIAVDNYFSTYMLGNKNYINYKKQSDETYNEEEFALGKVTGPYTIELRYEDDDSTVIKKTIYSGESFIETNPFNDVGEHWFTIRCIDSNGVASPTHYLDVYVEDPNYEPNFLQVIDNDLGTFDIVPDNDNDIIAYKNKKGFTDLFSYAVNEGYNGVVLPTHTYYIIDYANQSSIEGQIDFNNNVNYYMIEIENRVDANNNVIGNKLKSKTSRTLSQVKTDYDELFRYRWYAQNYESIDGAPSYDFGTHIDDIVYKNAINTGYFGNLPTAVQTVLKTYRKTFKVWPRSDADSIQVDDINLKDASGNLYKAGKYYIRSVATPTYDSIIFPSNFTVDLNNSILEVVNRYNDDIGVSFEGSITLKNCTNTHIVNGTLSGGLDKCDWYRAVCEASTPYYNDSDSNPFEHSVLFGVYGCRFCSFERLDIREYKGYGSNHSYDSNINYRKISASDVTDNGRYNNRYLDTNGILQINTEDHKTTFVISNKNVTHPYDGNGNELVDSITNTYIDYIPLANRQISGNDQTRDYIFVGYTVNEVSDRAKRKEIFIFFYDDNNVLKKVVKTKLTWLVRIPTGATKVRIMGYTLTKTSWRVISIYQVTGTVGMVYKDLNIYNTRSCIFNGDQRQVLHDNITFKNIALYSIVTRNGEGGWRPITALCIDIEDSGVLAKYFTIRNCRVDKDENYNNIVRGMVFQKGENVTVINNEGFAFDDRAGVQSCLVKNNKFIISGNGSCIGLRRGGAYNNLHPYNQYQDNECTSELPYNYWGARTVNYNTSWGTKQPEQESLDLSLYDAYRDFHTNMRMLKLNRPIGRYMDDYTPLYVNFQNTKNGDEYID